MTSIRILRSNHISIFKDFLGVVALLVSCFCSSPFYSNTFSTFSPLFLECTFFLLNNDSNKRKDKKASMLAQNCQRVLLLFLFPPEAQKRQKQTAACSLRGGQCAWWSRGRRRRKWNEIWAKCQKIKNRTKIIGNSAKLNSLPFSVAAESLPFFRVAVKWVKFPWKWRCCCCCWGSFLPSFECSDINSSAGKQ